ncbi:MAG: MFS transporter [Trueperaceae bacterium]|nr:MFS transporter [Trueperaceae bacterium]
MVGRAPRNLALSGLRLSLLVTFAHTVNDGFTNVLPVFLPTLQARFSLGEAVLAVAVAVISTSSNVLQPFFGLFVDKWGRRRSAAIGLGVGSVLMGFVSVSPNLASLFFILAFGGIGSAIFHPAAAAIARTTGAPVGLSMSLFAAGGSVGTAIMPVVLLAVVRSAGTEYVPLLSLVGVLMATLLFLLTPPYPAPVHPSGHKVFDPQLIRGPVGLLAGAGIMRAMAFITFTNAVPLYLANVRGFAPDAQVIGWTLSVYSFASASGGIIAGTLEHRFGRRLLVVGSMVLATPALLAMMLVPVGTPVYYIAVALGGLLTNASIPLLVMSAQDLAPNNVASASGMLMGFTWGIAGVVYIGFGAVQQLVGLVPAMLAGFAFLLPAAALASFVLNRYVPRQERPLG